jgi:competence protein ComEA
MSWRLSWFSFFSFLELSAGLTGLFFVIYGCYVLIVERASVPSCSLEILNNKTTELVAHQPKLTVEVMGAVTNPGVWQFERGSRVGQAIDQAGGVTNEASREFVAKTLNLAERLTDGQKIYIPFSWEEELVKETQASVNNVTKLVSINTASSDELMTLKGIGEARATAIIENRPYLQLSELVTKEVVSEGVFGEIMELISL